MDCTDHGGKSDVCHCSTFRFADSIYGTRLLVVSLPSPRACVESCFAEAGAKPTDSEEELECGLEAEWLNACHALGLRVHTVKLRRFTIFVKLVQTYSVLLCGMVERLPTSSVARLKPAYLISDPRRGMRVASERQ